MQKVCGRTGAGKSSVMMTLFRVSELMSPNDVLEIKDVDKTAESNNLSSGIYIDGVNIAAVPLKTLRSNLSIIPQDPILFTGNIRFQLDPFNQHGDASIWEVLEQVCLKEYVQNLPEKLLDPVMENGSNLSQGQRQLICIARALLRRAKILVMDEGTSAVDPATDALIQKVLKQSAEQHGTTVLAIAHRLQTIVDFDKVLVMSHGVVVEFDHPGVLSANPSSTFARMLQESNH
jgi:ABC-type multidrug transport system fused ATPase/permease subunit